MNKNCLLLIVILFTIMQAFSQNEAENIYDPSLDGEEQIAQALIKAKKSSKHVLIQLGGNWCTWCLRMHKFIREDADIDSLINADYIYILVNYSKENKNEVLLKQLEYPQRFGFPVLIILNADAKRLHTQNTAYLEQEKSYNRELILEFLKQWNVNAIEPSSYKYQVDKYFK